MNLRTRYGFSVGDEIRAVVEAARLKAALGAKMSKMPRFDWGERPYGSHEPALTRRLPQRR